MTQDKLNEECGVFGIYGAGESTPAYSTYLGLYALQHRGQQSCGIAVNDMGVIDYYRGMGLVSEVFNDKVLEQLSGQMAIGHVRYAAAASSKIENAEPLVIRYAKGRIAFAQNGTIVNREEIHKKLSRDGAIFQTTTDTEIIAHLVARERLSTHSIEDAVVSAAAQLKGAFSLLVMSPKKLVAARDPMGFRPMCIGELADSIIVASESCALDAVGAKFIRDVEPGEVIVIDENGLRTVKKGDASKKRACIFEYVYFARPDSVCDGTCVHEARVMAGRLLAQQHPVEADLVIGVPDSGIDSAIGYAKESGIPFGTGFVRNNYVGRTFIKPVQKDRMASVNIKLNVLNQAVEGKRIVMVDDSIVRGTTCANIVKMLMEAGAKEVHVRISSPTVKWPCYFGTDIPTREELTANHHNVEELCEIIGATTLGFLDSKTLPALVNEPIGGKKLICDACFTGDYPIIPDEENN